jgi:hypothetical protein
MSSHPANWYPDPSRRHELRYWDGARWTEHVSDAGRTSVDPVDAPAPVQLNTSADQIRQQVSGEATYRSAGVAPVGGGGGTIFTEPILVVNQKAKLIELTNE